MLLELNSETQVRRQWPRWLSYRIGLLPLPVFVLLFGAVVALTDAHALTGDVSVMIATLAAGGFLCAWLGGLVPFLRRLGAPAITAAFLPSYLVYRHWLPANLVETVTSFTKGTNFIYLYISAIIVGSILGMKRKLLLQGIAKVLIPLFVGSLIAILIGSVAGVAIGLPLARIVTQVIVPVMAGGVGEGAIPLSIGYEDIFHQSSAEYLAHLLPVVLFANLVAIIMAGCLNTIGRRYPSLTGNGLLQPPSNILPLPPLNVAPIALKNDQLCAAALFGISLYLLGILSHFLLGFPPPVTMLVLAVLLKVTNLLPPWVDRAAAAVGHFFAIAVTYPLLFAVAIALTPWKSVKEALHPENLAVIVLVVLTLVVTGFFIGKWIHLYPVETAIVNACHTGAGGTGDVAILTAANRLELMPFAQIATRIGGAITVTLTLLILRFLTHGK